MWPSRFSPTCSSARHPLLSKSSSPPFSLSGYLPQIIYRDIGSSTLIPCTIVRCDRRQTTICVGEDGGRYLAACTCRRCCPPASKGRAEGGGCLVQGMLTLNLTACSEFSYSRQSTTTVAKKSTGSNCQVASSSFLTLTHSILADTVPAWPSLACPLPLSEAERC